MMYHDSSDLFFIDIKVFKLFNDIGNNVGHAAAEEKILPFSF